MTIRAILLAISMSAAVLSGFERAAETPTPRGAGEAPVCDPGGPYACYTVIQFDARQSYDPDGTIVSYTWDFGDGQAGTGALVSHQYGSPGTYTVSLIVVDDDKIASQCETTVEIWGPCGDCPPVCDTGGPYQGIVGESVLLDGSGSYSATPCVPIVSFAWDFGDGVTGLGQQVSHTYSAPGLFTVYLALTDAEEYVTVCETYAEIASPSPTAPATWGRIKHRRGR
jgi:hypothetical protein